MGNKKLTNIIIDYIKKHPNVSDKQLLTYLHRKVGKEIHFVKDDKTGYWNQTVSDILAMLISFKYVDLVITPKNFHYTLKDGQLQF